MKFIDILAAKSAYNNGENITQHLRKKFDTDENSSEIIEIAYDLQAGSYIENFNADRKKSEDCTRELSEILRPHLRVGDSLLDVGTGEITT